MLKPVDDRIDDARRAVHDVERRMEPMLRRVLRAAISTGSSSVTQPVSTLFMWMPSAGSRRRRARHHVQRRLGHVRVRMARRLELPVELALHRRHVDDVLVALGRAQHQRLEARVQDERRDGVHQLHLEQLDRRHLGQQQPPGVPLAQVDLLQILVEPALAGTASFCASSSSGSSATCDSSAACVSPATSESRARASRARRRRLAPPAACGSRAGLRTRRAACARARACRAAPPSPPSIMCS